MFFATPELIERTRQLCADDASSAALHDTLLRVELAVHRTGWGSPDGRPHLFQLDMHPDTHDTDWRLCDGFNETLHTLLNANDGHTGQAIQTLAHETESAISFLRTGALRTGWADEEVQATLSKLEPSPALLSAAAADLDLTAAYKEGYAFLGYGLRSELWGVRTPDNPAGRKQTKQLAHAHRLSLHPARQELRDVWFITRTGDLWIVDRRRSHTPTVVVIPADDTTYRPWLVGGIFNGLSRIVNAVVTDDVPIWPRTAPAQPPQASRPNPLIRPNS